MKYLLFLDIDFSSNAALLAKKIREQDPEARFCGIYSATPNVLHDFWGELPKSFPMSEDIPSLDALERKWPIESDISRLPYYEKLLGSQAINECLIADKYVGSGYISSGHFYEAPLKRMCRETDAQRKYLVGMFDFLFDFMERERPDVFFFYAVAGAFAVACRHVATHFGVAYRRPHGTRIGNHYAIGWDEREGIPHIMETFREFCNKPELAGADRVTAKKYLDDFNSRPEAPSYQKVAVETLGAKLPLLAHIFLLMQTLHPLYQPNTVQVPYPSQILLSYFKQRWGLRHWFSGPEWKRWEDLADKKLAYYPLHYDPESTTMVFSPMLTDQVAIVEAVSKAIPPSWTLAVKEHRTMMGRRPREVYERLRRIPKVELVHPMEDQFRFIKNSQLTVTISGTGGFEAMMLGNVPLFLGNMYAQGLEEGFVQCSDFARLPVAVEEALEALPVDRQKLELFLAAIFRHSFTMPDLFLYETGGRLSEEVRHQSALSMASALKETLATAGSQ